MKLVAWIFYILLSAKALAIAVSSSPSSPLAVAADYYSSKHDYNQSLDLWTKVYTTEPQSVEAMLKVSELELLIKGHETAQQTILQFLKKQKNILSPSVIKDIQGRLWIMQNRFIKDESQSLYLQAMTKIKLLDFSQGLALLNRSIALENGNLLVLQAKANCEKKLSLFNKFYETLKLASSVVEMNRGWSESLLEAQYYFKDYGDVVTWFELQVKSTLSPRQRLSSGMALIETGQEKEGALLLSQLHNSRQSNPVFPILWYGLGRVLIKKPATIGAGVQYLERFLSATGQVDTLSIDGWDPYRSLEKVAEVKAWLADIKQTP